MKERSRAANGERKTERKRGRRREQSLGIFETCLFRIQWRRHEQLMHRTGRLSKNSGGRKAIKQDFERCSPVLFNTNIPFRCPATKSHKKGEDLTLPSYRCGGVSMINIRIFDSMGGVKRWSSSFMCEPSSFRMSGFRD